MRRLLSLPFLVLLFLPVEKASANIVFNVSGVTLTDVTTTSLSGTFTTNDARTALVTYDITAPFQVSGAFTFPGFEYTPATSTVTSNALPNSFRIDSPGSVNELQLVFTSGLSVTGATIAANSYEHEQAAGNRTATGQVTLFGPTTPEPSTVGFLGCALAAAFSVSRKRRAR